MTEISRDELIARLRQLDLDPERLPATGNPDQPCPLDAEDRLVPRDRALLDCLDAAAAAPEETLAAATRTLLDGRELVARICGSRAAALEILDAAGLPAERLFRDGDPEDGAPWCADESDSAFRTSRGLRHRDYDDRADAILLGPSIALGAECWLLLGESIPATPAPAERSDLVLVATGLSRLLQAPPTDAIERSGEALRSAFGQACAEHDLQARLEGPAGRMRFVFDGQENASPELIAQHYVLELQQLGWTTAGLLLPWSGMDRASAAGALQGAAARIRTLLIEYNSHLCGGLPWVFPGGDELLRDRGLARYRYPAQGEVDVDFDPDDESVWIRFAPHELGPVTSSGFYIPSIVRGNFDLRIDYRIESWEPGPDSACLGLFSQNQTSSHRYYAQRMSSGEAPDAHRVLAGFPRGLQGQRAVEGSEGSLRLQRIGTTMRASHRSPGAPSWDELGVDTGANTDDVILGCKIWSKDRCGTIAVRLSGLTVQGEVPREQIPPLEPRPDPRQGR